MVDGEQWNMPHKVLDKFKKKKKQKRNCSLYLQMCFKYMGKGSLVQHARDKGQEMGFPRKKNDHFRVEANILMPKLFKNWTKYSFSCVCVCV